MTNVLVWKDHGTVDVYSATDNNFETIKNLAVNRMVSGYRKEDVKKVIKTTNWIDLAHEVREATWDDENFEMFKIVKLHE